MTEKQSSPADKPENQEIFEMDGYRLTLETNDDKPAVVIMGRGLATINPFLGDRYPLNYVMFQHDPATGEVQVFTQGDQASQSHNFVISAEVLREAIARLQIEPGA